ncbi:MAG: type II secretion system protein [Atribacterota bacterium]
MKNHRYEEGFTLIQAIVSVCLAIMFASLVYFQLQMINRLERRSEILMGALNVAINTMESLKLQDDLSVGFGEEAEGGFYVFTQIEEFSSSLYRLKVMVKKGNEEIISLQTLRKK